MYNKWVFPSTQSISNEFDREVVNKNLWLHIDNIPTSKQEFVQLVKKSPVVTVDKNIDFRIEYRSRTKTKDELLNLLKTYKSWGTFRTPETLDALYNKFNNNSELDMPILIGYIRNGNKVVRVLSGNTRMDIAFQLNNEVKAIFVDLTTPI
jgi:hypothetical protein